MLTLVPEPDETLCECASCQRLAHEPMALRVMRSRFHQLMDEKRGRRVESRTKHRYELTEQDRQQAESFWLDMLRLKPGSSRTTRSMKQRHVNEVSGKLAEVVCGKALGLPVDWTVKPWTGDDNGIDFTLRCGKTLDAKAVQVHTNMDYDFSLVMQLKKLKADLFALVLIAPGQEYGVIVGGISKERFRLLSQEEAGWEHMGNVTPLTVRRGMLLSFDRVLEMEREAQ